MHCQPGRFQYIFMQLIVCNARRFRWLMGIREGLAGNHGGSFRKDDDEHGGQKLLCETTRVACANSSC